jgi:ABC-type proline/glycine betaine transport system substrate-binding protein
MLIRQYLGVWVVLVVCIIASQRSYSAPPESGGKVTINEMETKGGQTLAKVVAKAVLKKIG